jgi:hypothetical protein
MSSVVFAARPSFQFPIRSARPSFQFPIRFLSGSYPVIAVLFLITYVPGIVLFLPRLVGFQG